MALVSVMATIPPGGARQGDEIDCSSARSAQPRAWPAASCSSARCKARTSNATASMPSPKGRCNWTTPSSRRVAGCITAAGWKRTSSTSLPRTTRSRWCWTSITPISRLAQEIAEVINSQLAIQAGEPLARPHQPGERRSQDPGPVPRRNRVVRQPGAGPDGRRAADRGPRGDQRAGRQHRDRRRRGNRPGRGDAQEHRGRDGRQPAGQPLPAGGPQQSADHEAQALVEALNGIKVPTQDIIEIIKGLERNGKLHGHVIIE